MRIDLHAHTSGMSDCAHSDYKEMVLSYKNAGFDGVVLTNHYNFLYTKAYGGRYLPNEYPNKYLEEFYNAREYGAQNGLKVFFGIEVAIRLPKCSYAEFLYYGLEPDDLLKYANMYDLNQQGLYEIARQNGAILVQSHPFRIQQGHFPHDPQFMDGVEINCHARFLRDEEKVREFAQKHDLFITCGSDYHVAFQAGCAGVDFFDEVKDEKDLANKIRRGEYSLYIK